MLRFIIAIAVAERDIGLIDIIYHILIMMYTMHAASGSTIMMRSGEERR